MERETPGYHDTKEQVLRRLRRIEGQIRGLQRMVDDEAYCIDVLTQVAAATKALQGVGLQLLEEHLNHCVADAARQGDPGPLVTEATRAVERLLRT
jgi:DNA-binding FrmR family transcriptional regulator